MNIDKSRIIDKTVRDIVPTFIDEVSHKTWRKLPTSTINLLSNCILRYVNSYGTTYQISQTKELTIVSNKGQSYTLESYTKFLNLIIVDYQDPSEDKPMKIIKQSSYQIGDKVKIREDLKDHKNAHSTMCELAGTIVTITDIVNNAYRFEDSRPFFWSADMFEGLVVEDTPQPTPTDIKVGTHWERLKDFKGFVGYKAGEIVTLTKVTETYVNYSGGRGKGIEDFLKTFKPRPDLDNPPVKSKPVVSKKEANPKPTKNENTFMSKIKESASATVDQNKQALVIASKMEAGRIINKQVLKQLTPHLPFFLQGYVKSPFAPFVAANLVAMVANHTGNSKLTKVSDLMLLGAADSGVAAFNLDKIVDDILSNIKLPAGILDDNDDN